MDGHVITRCYWITSYPISQWPSKSQDGAGATRADLNKITYFLYPSPSDFHNFAKYFSVFRGCGRGVSGGRKKISIE